MSTFISPEYITIRLHLNTKNSIEGAHQFIYCELLLTINRVPYHALKHRKTPFDIPSFGLRYSSWSERQENAHKTQCYLDLVIQNMMITWYSILQCPILSHMSCSPSLSLVLFDTIFNRIKHILKLIKRVIWRGLLPMPASLHHHRWIKICCPYWCQK